MYIKAKRSTRCRARVSVKPQQQIQDSCCAGRQTSGASSRSRTRAVQADRHLEPVLGPGSGDVALPRPLLFEEKVEPRGVDAPSAGVSNEV